MSTKTNTQTYTPRVKQPGVFSRANSLISTVLNKSDSVVNEVLTSTELGTKILTNTLEEMHNDSISDVMESRMVTFQKLHECNEKLKELGYNESIMDAKLILKR